MLLGVTLVAEHNVGAHAALPCLMQDWVLHGKETHAAICCVENGRDMLCFRCVCACVCAGFLSLSLWFNLSLTCFDSVRVTAAAASPLPGH